MVITALAPARPASTARSGWAVLSSDSITPAPLLQETNAHSGLVSPSRCGTLNRRDCCEASSKILRQRSERFVAAASKPFSLRAAASGTILLTPSSVAFSIAHSNASNFTIARSSVTSRLGFRTGISSCSANSMRSRLARSIRATNTRWPSLSSYCWPSCARSTRPRW